MTMAQQRLCTARCPSAMAVGVHPPFSPRVTLPRPPAPQGRYNALREHKPDAPPGSEPSSDNPMSVSHFQAPDAPGFKLDPRVVGAFGRFAGGFWQGATSFPRLGADAGAGRLPDPLHRRHGGPQPLESLVFRQPGGPRRGRADPGRAACSALIIAAMAAIGVGIVLTRETLQVRLARLDRRAPGRPLAVAPALLPPQRHRQGAAQPRIPHLRRHALGHRAAGGPRHRPGAGGGGRGRLHLHPVDGRRLLHAAIWARSARSRSPPTW